METFINTVKYYFYYWDSQFTSFPIVTRTITAITVLLALLYIFVLIKILFIEYKWRKKKKRYKIISSRYGDKIRIILFSLENYSGENIKSVLNVEVESLKKWEKAHITNLLLVIKSEEHRNPLNRNNYLSVIEFFTLISYWEIYLCSKKFKKNKQALRKLESLGVHISGTILANKVQVLNRDLRKHAKSGYIRFAQYDPFKFLENGFDREFNPLDEIRIHASLKERAKLKPLPSFIRWVNSTEDDSYKCFFIDEIGHFQQKESASQLLELYQNTKSNRIKAKIAETVGILKYIEAEQVLINSFDSNPEYVQSYIIEALTQFATPKSLIFLEKISRQVTDDDLYIKIVQNIYKIDNEKKETFHKLRQDTTNDFQKSVFASIEQIEMSELTV